MENIKYLFSGSLLNQDANFRIFSNPFLESTSFCFSSFFLQMIAGRHTFPGQIKNEKA